MTGAFLGAVTVALLAGTGLTVAATLRLRSLPEALLGAYVIAFAEVVVVTFALSAFSAVTRAALLAAMAGVLAGAVSAWLRLGKPRLPRISARSLRALLATPVLLALAVLVALALAYVVALIVGTAPNTWDSMTYHLARAAFWSQDGGVGYISEAYDERLDYSPPHAEIALTFVLEVTRNERLAAFVQLAAGLALALGVFAVARKLGLTRRAAAFGALLVLTLPIVVLQASTTQNDLVAGSLLMAATVFLLGSSRRVLVLAAVATALALGTKIPAVYALPLLGATALVAPPKTYRVERLAALLAGAVAGSYWYAANVARFGHPLGENPDPTGLVALFEPKQNLLGAYARVLDALDLSGAEGADLYAYVIVAAVVAASLLATQRKPATAIGTGALVSLPLLLIPVGYALWRPFAKLHDVLGTPAGTLPVAGWERQDSASDTFSWYGPLGLFFVVGVGVAAIVLARRGSVPLLAIVFATAPLTWLVLFSLSVGYDPWQGRFLLFPVALSASLWGLVLRVRPVAIASVAVASVTAALSLVNYVEKPSGLQLLGGAAPTSVWDMERWEVQSILRFEMGPVLKFLETRVPDDGTIALALRGDDFGYPAFGAHLDRRVELVPGEGGIRTRSRAEWLLASPRHAPAVDEACWTPALATPEGWKIFRARAANEAAC